MPSTPHSFALYRILGNSLPPRHGPDEMLEHLRFVLRHEPDLVGCEKHWVLNRIVDPHAEEACLELVRAAGHGVIHIPFEVDRYAERFVDTTGLPPGIEHVDPTQGQGAFAASTAALEWKYRHKSLYAIALNEARNRALVDGRSRATWTLPWDGACFVTAQAWSMVRQLAQSAPETALHLVVPMARLKDNQVLLRQGFQPTDLTEPQLGFRHNSEERFDESLR